MKATFKGCWKGAQQKWILVDMHDQPPWVNKLLFPLAIKNKQSELCQAGLEACHYVEEFYLWWIRPLGHRKKLAFECL
jgi:hypothetical protein